MSPDARGLKLVCSKCQGEQIIETPQHTRAEAHHLAGVMDGTDRMYVVDPRAPMPDDGTPGMERAFRSKCCGVVFDAVVFGYDEDDSPG